MKKNYLLYLITLLTLSLSAQVEQSFPEFIVDGRSLPLATAGGMSAPQFSEVDLNNDGIQDLYIYDKIGQVGMTFINGGTQNQVDYHYAPKFLVNFPELTEWALLRDYNGDGIQDIFAYSSTPGVAGIEVYTGYYNEANQIAFRPFQFFLGDFNIIYYPGGSGFNNLFVSNVDYPAVDDIDGDGDLDILTFNISGGIVELYTNQSVERGYGLDSLLFALTDDCWGKFFESGITLEIDLPVGIDNCAGRFRAPTSTSRSGIHAGSTVTTLDMDNDGDKEVLLGDVSFTNLNLVTNGGTASQAFMTQQDVTFPRNTTPVNIPLFPASFILDINNDGLRDLVAAPNLGNDIGETYEVGWYYANINTNENPVFDYRFNDLLVGDMLDFGTGANPVFVDYDADGLQDLVIGNKSFFVPGGEKNARLFLFKNIGTPTVPKFELIDDDYLGLNDFSNSAWRFSPTFGDMDNDGDLDILIGEEFGGLFYGENLAGPNQALQFGPIQFGYQDLDVGQVSKPQIIDINEDGLVDLIIGERSGNVNYYENVGSIGNPVFEFEPTDKNFGAIDVREEGFVVGYSAPTFVNVGEEVQLFTGSQSGTINRYTDVTINEALPLIDNGLGILRNGEETHLAFADIDGDNLLELAVGNIRGGISFYETQLPASTTSTATEEFANTALAIQVYPNPVQDVLEIDLPANLNPSTLTIHNMMGQVVHTQAYESTLPVAALPVGVYILEINTLKGTIAKKLIKY